MEDKKCMISVQNVTMTFRKEEDFSLYCLSISKGKSAPECLGDAEMPGKQISLFD